MAKITGLGGVFHVVKDPKATRAWYKEYLGLEGEYGPMLKWSEETGEKPYSLISHFTDDAYMKPSASGFMINLRVDNVEEFMEQLKAKGIEILDFTDEGYSKFAWILDCDGIKIELWEQCAAPD